MSNITEPLFNLNSDKSHKWDDRTKGRAPHKPFLLLSILDGISEGWIDTNSIFLEQNLVDCFFGYWDKVMGPERLTTVALPYYHMNSESFWDLIYKPGENDFGYSPSLGGIKQRIVHARVDEQLFNLLIIKKERQKVWAQLLETYFSDATAALIESIRKENRLTFEYSGKLLSMVAEPFKANHTDVTKKYYRKVRTQIRNQGFSRVIRECYSYSCSICQDKIITPGGKALVEGAHIIPWNESNNDDPRNGISLCPTHHWMFDNFMFTIREDFTLQLSKWTTKKDAQVRDLMKMKNAKIKLPNNSNLHPAKDALLYHAGKFKEAHKEWK